MPRLRVLAACLLMLIALVGQASPQESSDTVLASACQASASVAAAELHDAAFRSAVVRLVNCDVTGPPVIAQLWASASTEAIARRVLVQATPELRDARILDTLVAIAERTSASSALRISALRALLGYFEPRLAVEDGVLNSPGPNSVLVDVSHANTTAGANPLPSNFRTTIGTLLKNLSIGEANTQVKAAAAFLRRTLYYVDPAAMPLPGTEAVGVVYICGRRFRLRNWDDMPLKLRYRVGETADSGRIEIDPRPAGQSYRELFFTTKLVGTVKVWHGTTLLQTAANGGTACAL